MSYIKLEDAKNAIMNCITEQTVSKYATSAECRAARHGADLALFAIDYVPTADVVEVVRCKDCRFWKECSVENADTHIPLEELWEVKLPIKSVGIGICECEKFYGDYKDERLKLYRSLNPLETTKNDYCSYGERKEK